VFDRRLGAVVASLHSDSDRSTACFVKGDCPVNLVAKASIFEYQSDRRTLQDFKYHHTSVHREPNQDPKVNPEVFGECAQN
jgi:hypothetical protein